MRLDKRYGLNLTTYQPLSPFENESTPSRAPRGY
ncbi:hypothetical protein Vi05172_g6092 [Venturia inaequalis]|nr:hypothetical protein Vi05172_g6092 [Venturia inaequalis]